MRPQIRAFEAGGVLHSSGRLQSSGGWRPDQPDPIGAARASPTPVKHVPSRASDFKGRTASACSDAANTAIVAISKSAPAASMPIGSRLSSTAIQSTVSVCEREQSQHLWHTLLSPVRSPYWSTFEDRPPCRRGVAMRIRDRCRCIGGRTPGVRRNARQSIS